MEEHAATITKNVRNNGLDLSRADIRIGDLFAPFAGETFGLIAANPPYIPETRDLPMEVAAHEPAEALLAEADGLGVIRRICKEAKNFLTLHGEVWMECDIENIEEAKELALGGGATRAEIRMDQYQRPRLLVAYY
jgi:release factor glutamine methyltransferase